jgi:hypothetical protein
MRSRAFEENYAAVRKIWMLNLTKPADTPEPGGDLEMPPGKAQISSPDATTGVFLNL